MIEHLDSVIRGCVLFTIRRDTFDSEGAWFGESRRLWDVRCDTPGSQCQFVFTVQLQSDWSGIHLAIAFRRAYDLCWVLTVAFILPE